MKTKLASLLVVMLISTISCMAQRTIRVEANNNDISDNLDLQAVASLFGESKNLQDLEMRLNDYDSQISNLDLNNDGEVDYLRVIESSEDNVHVVVIQAVLDRDVYQDVATIVVERNNNRRTHIQVIGDPYMYGENYIIEPVYVYTPSIFSFFWGGRYTPWHSPYYWGYYPTYYHRYHPYEVGIYLNHISSHINRNYKYYYSERRINQNAERLHKSVSRNDYGNRFPERNFSNRNENVRNKYDIKSRRNSDAPALQTRPTYQRNELGTRNPGAINGRNDSQNSNRVNRTYTPATTPSRNTEINRTQEVERSPRNVTNSNNRVSEERSTNSRLNSNSEPRHIQSTNETRQTTPVVRESNTKTTPVVSQPSRSAETKQVEVKRSNPAPTNESRSSSSNSNRR